VGGSSPVIVDVRIIAASNMDLEKAVRENRFREDLYYRISVFPVTIPPLRERTEDIPALAEHFISVFSAEMNINPRKLTPSAMDMLKKYRWKGNVRELENVIERSLILAEGDSITENELRIGESGSLGDVLDEIASGGTLEDVTKEAVRIVETKRIRRALEETHGNKTRAAEILKVSYKTLLTKIKEYDISGKW
jgi:DNA-binding NtrC family response regulator